ncbi:aldehyde dehydrogenase family protein, partial [Streptosporangium algeriense]
MSSCHLPRIAIASGSCHYRPVVSGGRPEYPSSMAVTVGVDRTLDPAMVARIVQQVTSSGGTRTIIAPFTEEPLADMPVSTAQDVRAAYAKARAAQREWAAL